jgi:hypothetical protein
MVKERTHWRPVIAAGTALFLVQSAAFVVFGRVNADEGWYLYAGMQVFDGRRPYQDFAFTQTPLMPYGYGLFEKIFAPGLSLGRVLTAAFSLAAFLLCVGAAARRGGMKAGGIAALLGASFTYGIYFQSITKTYALTTLFFATALYALSFERKRDLHLILAAAAAWLAVLTRLSAAFFALPVLLYAFFASGMRGKAAILAVSLAAASWMAALTLPDPQAAAWGLVGYHASQWGVDSFAGRVAQIFLVRIPELLGAYPAYFLLFVVLALIGFRCARPLHGPGWDMVAVLAGWCLFVLPNLASGGFGAEYFVPWIFLSFPMAGIAFAKFSEQAGRFPWMALQTALLSALALGFLRGGYPFLEYSGGQTPVAKIRAAAAVVSRNTAPGDSIFAMEALWLAVESGRPAMPNASMAQFSYLQAATPTAERLHLLNGEIVCRYFTERVPKMVALTDGDWNILRTAPDFECIVDSLEKNYRLIDLEDGFGQHGDRLELYLRQEPA